MTSHPKDLSDELIDVMAHSQKVCRQLHLPLQSGSSRLLKIMNRHYTKESYLELAAKIKKAMPDIALTTDIIVGFPGETEQDFEDTMDVVEKVQYDSAFTFIYSKRTGTPAAAMEDQVPEEVKAERLDRLMKRQAAIARKKNQARVGTVEKVLVTDRNAHGEILGRSQREAPETDGEIIFTAGESKMPSIGDFVDVRIEKASTYDLTGVIA